MVESRKAALDKIVAERERQTAKWGSQWEPDHFAPAGKLAVLVEEVGEVAKELLEAEGQETEHLRKELVEVAAVCVAWIESLPSLPYQRSFKWRCSCAVCGYTTVSIASTRESAWDDLCNAYGWASGHSKDGGFWELFCPEHVSSLPSRSEHRQGDA